MNHSIIANLLTIITEYARDSHCEYLTSQVRVTPYCVTGMLFGLCDHTEVINLYLEEGSDTISIVLRDDKFEEIATHKVSVHDANHYPYDAINHMWLRFYS